jgi:Site-specific recombinase XerD
MLDYVKRFRDFLSSERNYSDHTVRAYMTDVGEFRSFLKEKRIAVNGEEIDISNVDEVAIRAYLSWLYSKKTRKHQYPENWLRSEPSTGFL